MKLLFFIVLLGGICTIAPQVSAGITFPECKWDEITVSCNCPHDPHSCADNTCPACLEYKNDPRYYFLWKDIYCRKASLLQLIAKYKYTFFIPLLTVIVLESAVFLIRGYRNIKHIMSLILVNCISFFVGIVLLGIVPKLVNGIFSILNIPDVPFLLYGMDIPRMGSLLLIAAMITALEVLFWIRVMQIKNRKYIIVTVVAANFISLILGIGTLNAIYPRLLQPRLF